MAHGALSLLLFGSLLLLPVAGAQTFAIDTVAGWPGIQDGGQATQAVLAQPVNGASQTIALAQYIRIANGAGGPLELTFNPANLQLVPINLGPASDQVYLVLFGTGFRLSTGPLAATVGGEAVGVAIAAAQGFSGLDQANLGPLPRTLIGRGAVTVSFSASEKQANPVMVNIQ